MRARACISRSPSSQVANVSAFRTSNTNNCIHKATQCQEALADRPQLVKEVFPHQFPGLLLRVRIFSDEREVEQCIGEAKGSARVAFGSMGHPARPGKQG